MRAATALHGASDDDFLRARFYGLLATLFAAPPPEDLLRRLAGLTGDESPMGAALLGLAKAAAIDPDQAAEEFSTLFVGVTGGELSPYASWYLTGFLHEKPLAELRADMARLGIEASPGTAEPEDHVASLLEMMQGLISGVFGDPLPIASQKAFFDAHLGNWIPRFLADLKNTPSARFYRAVAETGLVFLDIENQAFAMVE